VVTWHRGTATLMGPNERLVGVLPRSREEEEEEEEEEVVVVVVVVEFCLVAIERISAEFLNST